MNSAVTRAEDLKFSDEGVKEVLKSVILPLWSAYYFFVTYANTDGWQASDSANSGSVSDNPLDRWILSLLETLVSTVDSALSGYDMEGACKPIISFIDQLNNWYIRRSRRRFWKSENDSDKATAYATLHQVLLRFVTIAAPIIPFITEEIWQNLRSPGMAESVHLADYPRVLVSRLDKDLEMRMAITQQAVTMGRAIRSLHNLKIRQPLKSVYLVTRNQSEQHVLMEMEDIIRDELNVKDVVFRDNEEALVSYSAKANFKTLGPRLGKDMKLAAEVIAGFQSPEIIALMEGGTLSIEVAGQHVDITAEAVLVQRTEKEGLKVLNEGSLTVALDPEITEALRQEGVVRDVVRGIQNLRKLKGLNVSDRIALLFKVDAETRAALEAYSDYLTRETLCTDLAFSDLPQSDSLDGWDDSLSVSLRCQ
jgi:isoleucyl-tRNA synthetase